MRLYKVGISGITGRMGQMVLDLLQDDSFFACIGGVSRSGVHSTNDDKISNLHELVALSDVIIDFSSPEFALLTLDASAKLGKPLILGTTGFSEKERQLIQEQSKHSPIVMSANFSTGINALINIVTKISPRLHALGYDIEIHECHHRHKKDAPSGTAVTISESISTAICGDKSLVRANSYSGKRPSDKIGISFSRSGGVIGDHSVTLASENEVLEISHRAINRYAFADGAINAAKWVISKPNGIYSMADVMNG